MAPCVATLLTLSMAQVDQRATEMIHSNTFRNALFPSLGNPSTFSLSSAYYTTPSPLLPALLHIPTHHHKRPLLASLSTWGLSRANISYSTRPKVNISALLVTSSLMTSMGDQASNRDL